MTKRKDNGFIYKRIIVIPEQIAEQPPTWFYDEEKRKKCALFIYFDLQQQRLEDVLAQVEHWRQLEDAYSQEHDRKLPSGQRYLAFCSREEQYADIPDDLISRTAYTALAIFNGTEEYYRCSSDDERTAYLQTFCGDWEVIRPWRRAPFPAPRRDWMTPKRPAARTSVKI